MIISSRPRNASSSDLRVYIAVAAAEWASRIDAIPWASGALFVLPLGRLKKQNDACMSGFRIQNDVEYAGGHR